MADVSAAVIGFAGVLAGGYFNNFFAEDYKRFRDGQALAGALAGELKSHGEAVPFIRTNLQNLKAYAESGAELAMPEWPVPNSPIFEAIADRIGYLSPEDAKGVAYVYEQLRAFRGVLNQLSKYHKTFGREWCVTMVDSALVTIQRAEDKGEPLIENLSKHAEASYWKRPATLRQCAVGLVFVALLLGAMFYFSGSKDGTNCITVFNHDKGALTTVCK